MTTITGSTTDPATGKEAAATDTATLSPPRRIRVSAPPGSRGPARRLDVAAGPGSPIRRVRLGKARHESKVVSVEDELEARPLTDRPPTPLPDPTAQCCSVVRAAVEVLRGERPAAQLSRWVTPEVHDQLVERAQLVRGRASATRPVLVRRVRLVRLGDDVAEATVVLDDDGRVRAAAVRLEARRGVWRVAVLEIG